MSRIDPLARVADGARVAEDVEIGPYCIVGPQVELRSGVRLLSHVNIAGTTVIGERTVVHPFASLGSAPQSTGYRGGATRLTVGADCVIREGVTMNIGTEDGRGLTAVGDRGFYMAYAHVGHDCEVGDDVVFANGATLGGHCVIDDYVFIGGLSAVQQFTRVGAHAMVGGLTGQRSDVIPFGMTMGASARLRGLNLVGMRRRNFPAETIREVRVAYKRLFLGEGDFKERLQTVGRTLGENPAVAQIIAFIRGPHHRALCHPGGHRED